MRYVFWWQKRGQALAPSAPHEHPKLPPPVWKQTDPSVRRQVGRSWGVGGVLVLLVLFGVWVGHRPAEPSQAHVSGPGQALTGQSPLPASAQASPTPQRQPSPTSSPLAGLPPPLLAARFLGAYFTWEPTESDTAYVGSWQPAVEASALAVLIRNAPRLLLDGGADGAANGEHVPVAPFPLGHTGQQVQVQVTWTVQVWPAGGELTQWQARAVQATVALIESAPGGWQVAGLSWQAASAKGGD